MRSSIVTEVNMESRTVTLDTESTPAPWYWQPLLRALELFLLAPKPAWLARRGGKAVDRMIERIR